MRFGILAITLIVSATIVQSFLPWWVIAPLAFICGYFLQQTTFRAFLLGFVSIFMLWGGVAWIIHIRNAAILGTKMAALFQVRFPFILILLTALIGAVIAGISSISGSYLCNILNRTK